MVIVSPPWITPAIEAMTKCFGSLARTVIRRSLETWPEMTRASQGHEYAPIAEWHQRLDVLEARLAERSRKRLDAESAQIEDHAHAELDDAP